VKQALRLARRNGGESQPEIADATSAISSRRPIVTDEMIALHRCQWRLPHDKAVRLLDYVPPISFEEGCRRSVESLRPRAMRVVVPAPR